MSKRLDSKKETAIRLNEFYSALDTKRKPVESENDIRYKYGLLLKRFRELEKVYSFHRGIIQNISSGIITVDLLGKITFINQAALQNFGYNFQELQGKTIDVLFADPHEGKEVLTKVLEKKVMYESKETYFLIKDKEPVNVGFSTTYLKHPELDECEGIIFIFRSLENVANLRKQIERMDRLATLGELSAGIAHEIRNPLAGIKTSAQVLEESFSPGDFRSQLISRIVKEIDRSNALLKRFFNFARPSPPSQDFHNLHAIVDGVYLLLASKMKKKGITFKTKFQENLPKIYVDESQMEQVILNIFINAIEAIDNKGSITVETGIEDSVKLDEDKNNEPSVYAKISDTGIGIPKEKLEKIFNPFYTTKPDGVGLGLSISMRLLQENGGKMEAQSQTGSGSSFIIYLPIVK